MKKGIITYRFKDYTNITIRGGNIYICYRTPSKDYHETLIGSNISYLLIYAKNKSEDKKYGIEMISESLIGSIDLPESKYLEQHFYNVEKIKIYSKSKTAGIYIRIKHMVDFITTKKEG